LDVGELGERRWGGEEEMRGGGGLRRGVEGEIVDGELERRELIGRARD